ncbi:hypothetical protein F5B22DRAFT_290807 [Xylaria bambusicola]|uniref:uncharacterized protein n=1 Tax=Xylaria bambusicola TaxID=326684 RepID=UPI00200876B0|nr:uncharacterized protein F5B22DRAFT_290807 [Xylaria bambusicola]KAI0512719.1 hypothetical protein F5B22DRAFT_290807 [Xylaria bambusicola]
MAKGARNTITYHSLDAGDDEEFRTEILDLLNERDYLPASSQSKKARLLTFLCRYRWVVDALLVLVIITLLLDKFWPRSRDIEGNGDIVGFAPQFSQQIRKFSPDPGFVPENTSQFFSEATKKKWLDILPKGLGYLEVKDPGKYKNIPTNVATFKDRFVVATSMTHQLHCLHAIAEAYSALTSDSTRVPTDAEWHVAHCFDYLRQGIMCCGDVALEGDQTTFPEGVEGSDGWDAKHVCKDYSQILEYLNENRASDELWL